MTQPTNHAHAANPEPEQHTTAAANPALLTVEQATEADHAAYLAWSTNPADPDLLNAYVAARQQLRHTQAQAAAPDPATANGGPLVLTPVIEWWTT